MRDAGRCRRVLLGISMLAVLGACGPIGSANAAVTHLLQSSFEVPESNLRGMAFDETTESVYVLSQSPRTLKKFDASGTPSNFSGTGSDTIVLGTSPRTVAVDNSGGVNDGVIYIGTETNYAYVYTRAGLLSAQFNRSSSTDRYPGGGNGPFCGMAVDQGGNWLISHSQGFIQGPYLDKFHPGLWVGNASPQQNWPISGTMVGIPSNTCKLAMDGENSIYSSNSAVTSAGQLRKFPSSVFSLEKPPSKVIDPSSTAFAVDNSNNDLYSDRNASIAKFDSLGVLREVFATGEFEQSAGIAVSSSTSSVYAAIRKAGGETKHEVWIYTGVVTPDITEVSVDADKTTAQLDALIGTAGAGNVTDCKVEYGTTEEYAEPPVSCSPDASGTPYSGVQSVAAELAGLEKETTYHFRFTATNANGTNKDIDGTFTTHNVRHLMTADPSDLTRSSATLNGSFEGDGDLTSYEFEWGPSPSYGEVAPGGATSAVGPIPVSAPVTGLETYLPSGEGAYHYRIVATNGSGVTFGPDVSFHTLPPDLPQVSSSEASEIETSSARITANINPGGGDTLFSIDYGTDSGYGASSLVSTSIGNDATNHPVSSTLTDLKPGTSYHYRVVAVNFGGTTHGPDREFSTVSLPEPAPPTQPLPAAVVSPTPPLRTARKPRRKKCKRGFVKRRGKCIRRHRKKRHKKHHGKKHHKNRNGGRGVSK